MRGHGKLRFYMNLMALDSLPEDSAGPKGTFEQKLEQLWSNRFTGVQFAAPASAEALQVCRQLGMNVAGSGRVNEVSDAFSIAEQASGDGYDCATLHVGWGLEDDDQATSLIEAVLTAAQRWQVPLYFETHRATICQDMWRTVQFVRRFPELRFNADFSHWYAGQEMVYGGFARKLAFINPVLERVRFVHGRIANPGCIQVHVEPNQNHYEEPIYVQHFRQLWEESFRGFLRSSAAGEYICFAPELLSPDIYYARTFGGAEESDRWEQSLLLKQIAEECFQCALAS